MRNSMKYQGRTGFAHGTPPLAAVVLVNLGTPDSAQTGAVRRYLAEFLADPRVIEMPRLLWRLILHGVILRIRPRRSAHAYQQVWTERGSPLRFHTEDLVAATQAALQGKGQQRIEVHAAMRYGNPSLTSVLDGLMRRNLRRLLVLPLYPQYSGSTTGSVFDAVADTLKTWRWVPELGFVSDYYDRPGYAPLLAERVRAYRKQNGAGAHLLFSFHGIPERYLHAGDPYYCQCLATARLTAEQLQLNATQWSVSFQSRVGRERWLSPYTDTELKRLAGAGVKSLDVICPAFAVDCLETLEEIAMQGRDIFMAAGGEQFRYIPALNAGTDHARWLAQLIMQSTAHWPESNPERLADIDAHIGTSAARQAAALPQFDEQTRQ
jgi:protoporphyrin/coproporphyrin ferrochelatase